MISLEIRPKGVWEFLAKDEVFLDYMRQAYNWAYRRVCSLVYGEYRSGRHIARAAGDYLRARIEELEEDSFGQREKLYSLLDWLKVSGGKLSVTLAAFKKAEMGGGSVVLSEKVVLGVKKQKLTTAVVDEMLYNAGMVLISRMSEFRLVVSVQELQGLVFGIMRQTVEELSEVPGNGVIQAYAPVLRLNPAEAVKRFNRILVQDDELEREVSDIPAAIEQMRSLLVDSVNKWADGMKEHFVG